MGSVFWLIAARAQLPLEKATITVMASLVLHNMLRTKSEETYTTLRVQTTMVI